MKRLWQQRWLVGAVLLAGACTPSSSGPQDSAPAPGLSLPAAPRGTESDLARGYRLLAEYEAAVTGDDQAASLFTSRARQAEDGDTVAPLDPLSPDDETAQARASLLDAHPKYGDQNAAQAFAEAQLNYDCWVVRRARHDKTAAYCRARFYQQIGLASSNDSDAQHFIIPFRPGNETPDEAAFVLIRKAAASFDGKPGWRLHLTGHAVSQKTAQANILLSMRRAVAVRNYLLQNGIDPNKIVIGAVGAKDKTGAAPGLSPDRVEIAIVAVADDRPDAGPDITRIAPQYFGSSNPRFKSVDQTGD